MTRIVRVSRREVEAFASRWPGSDLPDRAITFHFASNGDLEDIFPESSSFDGPDLSALADDARDGKVGKQLYPK